MTTQEIVQEWCEHHAEHKSVPGTKFVSGRILCSREDVLELINKATDGALIARYEAEDEASFLRAQLQPVPENDRCMRRCPTCGAHYFGPPLHYGFKQWCVTPGAKI